MKELHDLPEMSKGARALLDETRSMDDPSGADRDRVKRAMLGAIAGGGALAATTAASSTAAAAGSTAAATTAAATTAAATTAAATTAVTAAGVSLSIKIAAAVLVAGAVGGTALVVTQPAQPTAPTPVAVEEALPAPTVEEAPAQPMPAPVVIAEAEVIDPPVLEEATLEEAPEIATPAPSAPRTSRPAVRAPPVVEPATPSSLQAEVALLRRAQRDIAAHDGSAALRHLDELARRFPDGVMGEERDAARVFALCESGRRDEARAAAQRFLRERPSSPLRARVAGACP